MWESSLYSKLINDTKLIRFVSTYTGGASEVPSIFSSSAPENVDFPYIVFTLDSSESPDDSVVDVFDVQIAVFDFNESAKDVRLAIRRIVELLDRQHLVDDYYKTIRLHRVSSFQANRENEDKDPRAQHYIARFSARACRKGWIDNFITT